MKSGYARASTTDQDVDFQLDALKKVSCEKTYSDYGVSGAKAERPGLDKALDLIRKENVPMIWKPDR